jgi:hypothetical protein
MRINTRVVNLNISIYLVVFWEWIRTADQIESKGFCVAFTVIGNNS